MEKDLKNVEKGFYEIKAAILANETVRKLLYYDTPNALSLVAPDIKNVEDHISFFPITEIGVSSYDKNTLINITCPTIDTDTEEHDNLYIGYFVTVITRKETSLLDNNKIRLISLITAINKSLDGKKLSFPSKLQSLGIQQVIYDEKTYGYVIKIFCSDLQKELEF